MDNALYVGLSRQMTLRRQLDIVANNIANADTPNYKARDIDFASAYSNALAGTGTLEKTSPLHLSTAGAGTADTKFRSPLSTSLDGNTVELHVEQLQFA